VTVRVIKDRVAEVVETIKKLTSKEVLVGIPRENAARKPEPGEKGEPINNAALGYIHEFGAPEANIPPRPFLIPGVEKVKDQAIARLKKAGELALNGDVSKVDAQLTAVGLLAQSAVQQKIVDGPFTPLKPRTLARRAARGRTGTKPLIDTGALRQAIAFVIVKKER
jgi:hypothetical protein